VTYPKGVTVHSLCHTAWVLQDPAGVVVQQVGLPATGDGAAGRATGYRWWCSRQSYRLQVMVNYRLHVVVHGAAGSTTGYR